MHVSADTQIDTLIASRITAYLELHEKSADAQVLQDTVQRMRQVIVRDLMQPRTTRAGKESNTLYSGPCARKARLTFDGAEREPMRARTVLKFLLGDLVELSVLAVANLAGAHIVDNNIDLSLTGKDGKSIDVHPDGRYVHVNGIEFNVEIKSCDSKTFDRWLEQGGPDDAWGYLCVPLDTEILTIDGWKTGTELNAGDIALGYDHKAGTLQWEPVTQVNRYPEFNGDLIRFKHHSLDMLCTDKHRVPVLKNGRPIVLLAEEIKPAQRQKIPVSGSYTASTIQHFDDNFVELVGWFVTEGCVHHRGKWAGNRYTGLGKKRNPNGMLIATISQKEGRFGERIKRLASIYGNTVHGPYSDGMLSWRVPSYMRDMLLSVAPKKELTVQFLSRLTRNQLHLLFETMIDGDGTRNGKAVHFWQKNSATRDAFEILCVMIGKAFKTSFKRNCDVGQTYVWNGESVGLETVKITRVKHDGMVWCPVLPSSFWVARRNGRVFMTGNTQASVEVAAWREYGHNVAGTLFLAVSTGTRQGSIAEFYKPYDEALVEAWHARRNEAQGMTVPGIPFTSQPEMKFVRGKELAAENFEHGQPTPRVNEKGATYGWDVPTGREIVPLVCTYCDFMSKQCWTKAEMELDGGKPVWVVQEQKNLVGK